jgi:hypothetical protein
MVDLQIIWDLEDDPKGNYWHIVVEGHDISQEEVEEILRDPNARVTTSRSSGRPSKYAWTSTGKHILVVFEEVLDDPLIVYPVTAYPTPPPKRKKR